MRRVLFGCWWLVLSAGCALDWRAKATDGAVADAELSDAQLSDVESSDAETPERDGEASDGDGGSDQLDTGLADAASDGPQEMEAGVDASEQVPDGGSDASALDTIPSDGLLLWLRADRGVSAESGSVSAWADQSPAHQVVAQPNLAQQPSYRAANASSAPAIVFDGVDDVLRVPGGFDDFTAGLTVLVVVRHVAITGAYVPYFEFSNGWELDDLSVGRYQGQFLFESEEEILSTSSAPDAVVHQFTALLRPTKELSVRRNGVPVGALVLDQLPHMVRREQVFVGASLYSEAVKFAGDFYELLVYKRALEAAELSTIENALRTRWACCAQ